MEPTTTDSDFQKFPKMARWTREIIITEKIDGTNAQIFIDESGTVMKVGSRTHWLGENEDNFGFYKWAMENRDELLKLGPGRHFGEWWGPGIQRGYGIAEKRFSLFNVSRWFDPRKAQLVGTPDANPCPSCCSVVPRLKHVAYPSSAAIDDALFDLKTNGSKASPGFMRPEGVVIFHTHSGTCFKKTLEKDEAGKGQ